MALKELTDGTSIGLAEEGTAHYDALVAAGFKEAGAEPAPVPESEPAPKQEPAPAPAKIAL